LLRGHETEQAYRAGPNRVVGRPGSFEVKEKHRLVRPDPHVRRFHVEVGERGPGIVVKNVECLGDTLHDSSGLKRSGSDWVEVLAIDPIADNEEVFEILAGDGLVRFVRTTERPDEAIVSAQKAVVIYASDV